MYKIRFHLGAGEHYMHWQVKSDDNVVYYNPEITHLHLQNCILKNNRKTAERIFLGENKTVCAWILCEKLHVRYDGDSGVPSWYTELKYNPKIRPYWYFSNSVDCLDNMAMYNIYTKKNKLYVGRLEEGYIIAT